MREAHSGRDDPGVRESLGSVGVALSTLVAPVTMFDQPPALPVSGAVSDRDSELAWQSSIGQFIFLQSLVHERI
jgi:hypothetical protein